MIAIRTPFIRAMAIAILQGLAPDTQAQTAPTRLPADVIAFVGRRASCLEWSKKATNAENAAQANNTADIMRSLKCSDIANDERLLRGQYAGSPDILRALDATWTKVITRLPPVRIAPGDLPRDE